MIGFVAGAVFIGQLAALPSWPVLCLLAGSAIIFAWLWWQNRDRSYAIAWVCCAVLAAWLNPVSLAITAAPFIWFFASAFKSMRQKDFAPVLQLLMVGFAIDLGLALLLFVPFSNDFASLAVKSGLHQANADTFLVASSLFAGSGSDTRES